MTRVRGPRTERGASGSANGTVPGKERIAVARSGLEDAADIRDALAALKEPGAKKLVQLKKELGLC